jgi:L-seryl-tRNA(Ser) seleniumtransferase
MTVTDKIQSELRKLPSVDELVSLARNQGAVTGTGFIELSWVRKVIDKARKKILKGESYSGHIELLEALTKQDQQIEIQRTKRVINATGIILHTNLGRSPLPKAIASQFTELTTGYCNLEIDLDSGERGKRGTYLTHLISKITGCEDALVVNNGAAAVLLMLSALARGGEAIVSRGELVQIGGGFRVPDIMEESGVSLREVGTTNMTNINDYTKAINKNTKMLLKVHTSNYYISGHTEEVALKALAAAGSTAGVPVAMDLGSGGMAEWPHLDKKDDPTVKQVLDAGVDLVSFSGDKLLGGPQAGIIAGKAELIQTMRKHPLYRAFRVGRLTAVCLQEVLQLLVNKDLNQFPALEMSKIPLDQLEKRCNELANQLKEKKIHTIIKDGSGAIGGGSSPATEVPTKLLTLPTKDPNELAKQLRKCDLPIITRLDSNSIQFDLRTVEPEYDQVIATSLGKIFKDHPELI